MQQGFLGRFLGGPPTAVAVRLILLSIIVGVVLAALGLDPFNVWRSLERLVTAVWDMGWGAISYVWRYFLLGAVIVVPIFLIARLVKSGSRPA